MSANFFEISYFEGVARNYSRASGLKDHRAITIGFNHYITNRYLPLSIFGEYHLIHAVKWLMLPFKMTCLLEAQVTYGIRLTMYRLVSILNQRKMVGFSHPTDKHNGSVITDLKQDGEIVGSASSTDGTNETRRVGVSHQQY